MKQQIHVGQTIETKDKTLKGRVINWWYENQNQIVLIEAINNVHRPWTINSENVDVIE